MSKEATFVQNGKLMNYVAGADIVVGQVIPLGSCIGIATTDIANGETGVLDLDGVYQMPAINTDNFDQGDELYWDDSAGKLTNVSTGNTPAGVCFETKLQAGTTAKVKLCPNFDAGSNDALKTEVGAAATITVGAEAADKINVIVQLKDITGANVSHKTMCQVWLSDAAAGALCAVAPSGAVAPNAAGTVVKALTAKTHQMIVSDDTGKFDLDITEAGAKTLYVNVEYQGRVYTSAAVTFAA